ncbi:hypothetical protein F4808DRAFT_424095, partial [Astrocystis sublimbata]
MAPRHQRHQRYTEKPKDSPRAQRPCSPDPSSTSTDCPSPHERRNDMEYASSLTSRPSPHKPCHTPTHTLAALSKDPRLIPSKMARRKSLPQSSTLHQPIGFVCCHCRYHSSGSYCSNPDYDGCPHKRVPRCDDCPIIFTLPRRTRNFKLEHSQLLASSANYILGLLVAHSVATVSSHKVLIEKDECGDYV